jgi:hypothetical protein
MRLVPERSPLPRLLVFPFGIVALSAGLLARYQADLVMKVAHCPLRDVTGLPCLTCGGTHTAVSLANGRWWEALQANPLVAVGLVLFLVWIIYGLLATAFPTLRRGLLVTRGEKRTARWLAALLLMAAWIRQIVFMTG